jgi:hypothetical protein
VEGRRWSNAAVQVASKHRMHNSHSAYGALMVPWRDVVRADIHSKLGPHVHFEGGNAVGYAGLGTARSLVELLRVWQRASGCHLLD